MEKVMIIIRDGYGKRDEREHNAVRVANTPFTDKLMETYPVCQLKTCGNAVGLPEGYMGGSEVGHLTIGSGRIIWQQLEMINRNIASGDFFQNKTLLEQIAYAKENNKAIHIIGLLQNKGVHAHQDHLFAMLKLCKQQNVPADKVYIHIFSDGRDSPATSLPAYVQELETIIQQEGIGIIGSLIGRYYAMDRDTRWERTEQAINLLMKGQGEQHATIHEAIQDAYNKKQTDEFITPRVIGNFKGIYQGDVIFSYNYRTDRVRQLFSKLLEYDIKASVMTQYYPTIPANIIFPTPHPKNLLGEVIAQHHLKQLRISETEKYPHITFFFNGQQDEPFAGEERILIPSPRDVATYDQKPEMSIYEITEQLVKKLEEDYSLIVVNFVNGDMVGHTGSMDAAVQAVEAVDKCVEQTITKALECNYHTIVFADHGNCEEMAGEHQTSHTLNDVDCILVSKEYQNATLHYGGLQDIAPTVLDLLKLPQPEEMTGKSLLK